MARSNHSCRYSNWVASKIPQPCKSDRTIFLCRTELEEALAAEIHHTLKPRIPPMVSGLGFVIAVGLPPTSRPDLIFEHQRIPNAGWIPHALLKPISDETSQSIFSPSHPWEPWTFHGYCPSGVQDQQWSRSAKGVRAALLRIVKSNQPEFAKLYLEPDQDCPATAHILQLLRVPQGAWFGWGEMTDGVVPYPAGIRRLKFDSRSPSRSYLKLEEAFQIMRKEPQPGQIVVDLGAAPGGWTHACLKRGAGVIAVDHGPMNIHPEFRKNLRIIKRNGITFIPDVQDLPVDWLVADMLVPPGTALGLIKHWLGHGRCRHAVINIKLPQHNPDQAVAPISVWLGNQSNAYQWALKNLHHDRREITLMASKRSGVTKDISSKTQ